MHHLNKGLDVYLKNYDNLLTYLCIDLFLTNRQKSFQNTSTFETGISDFHKLVVAVLKMYYNKQKPKIFQYRNYKTFNDESFKNELSRELT